MRIDSFRPLQASALPARPPGQPSTSLPADSFAGSAEPAGPRPKPGAPRPPLQLGAYPSVYFANGGPSTIPSRLKDLLEHPGSRVQPPAMPGQRWVVTPSIEASHFAQATQAPASELEDGPESELRQLIGPYLRERYGTGQGQTILELGPATSTTVAETLTGARYLGVDLSGPYLEKNSRMLEGRLAAEHYHALGDTYGLPVQEGSCDLVLTSCHPPFVSASPADKRLALDEVARALAPGGEFLLFPWDFARQPEEVNEHLLSRFELVDRRTSPAGPGRDLLVLKKR